MKKGKLRYSWIIFFRGWINLFWRLAGFNASLDLLAQLVALKVPVVEREAKGEKLQSPGLPSWFKDRERFVSEDCVRFLG